MRMFKDIYKEANKKIPINPKIIEDTENKIVQQSKGFTYKYKVFNRYKIAAIPICLVVILSLVVGIPHILNQTNDMHIVQPPHMKRPAPMEFQYPIDIKSNSNPLHINQEFTIESIEKNWEGSSTKLFYLKDNDSNTDELMYKHVLPSDSTLIGTAVIVQGQWCFKWKVPEEINTNGYGSFYIAAQSDKGIISGVRIQTLHYNSFDISPKEASLGQEVKYSISGFQEGCTMEIYLLQVKPGISPGERIKTLGNFKNTNGSLSSSFKLTESIDGNKITPGQYIIQATIIPKDEAKENRQAVFGYFNVN